MEEAKNGTYEELLEETIEDGYKVTKKDIEIEGEKLMDLCKRYNRARFLDKKKEGVTFSLIFMEGE